MSTLFRTTFICCLALSTTSCKSGTLAVSEPSSKLVVDERPPTLLAKAPDLIIHDMFYVPVKEGSDPEFPSLHYDLHVLVKNVGTTDAKNFVVVVISDEKRPGFDLVLLDPATDAHSAGPAIDSLLAGAVKELVWKQAANDIPGSGANFYIAIVDPPIGSNQFGDVEEGPSIAAEKNNVMGIPAPHE